MMKWEKVIIDDVLKYEQPTRYIVETEDYDDKFPTPVLTAGKSFLLGYTNEEENIFNDVPVIIFDDFTTSFQYVDFPFKVKSSAMKILKPVKEKADLKFLFYKMQSIKFKAGEHKRYWISKYSQQEIPLPPLSVQKTIAEKLDKVDALCKKDRELLKHYDDLAQSLFIEMFGDPIINNKNLPTEKGSNLFRFSSGKFNPASKLNENFTFPNYGGNGVNGFSEDFLIDKPTIIIGRVGAYCGSIHKNGGKCWVTDNAIYIKEFKQKINLEYVYRCFKFLNINRFADYCGQPKITQKPLENLDFPLPPLPLQQKFAGIIENIELQKQKVKLQAHESENLFHALLQESFGG